MVHVCPTKVFFLRTITGGRGELRIGINLSIDLSFINCIQV